MTSNILLKTAKTVSLPPDYASEQRETLLPACTLKWRKDKLWVKQVEDSYLPKLPALESEQWLIECLKRSPVQTVCLDPNLGEADLKTWADACRQANKQVFLRIPSNQQLLAKQKSVYWQIQRCLDWSIAFLLLLVLSPVMLGIALLVRFSSPGPLFSGSGALGSGVSCFKF